MRIHNYLKLDIYRRSLELAGKVIERIDEIKPYRLAEQIASSVVSVPSNIAEGSERGTSKEFCRYLDFSKGSAAEFITQIRILQLSGKYADWPLDEFIQEMTIIYKLVHAFKNALIKNSNTQ